METRRKALAGIAAGAAGLATVGLKGTAEACEDCERPSRGPHADYFPNVVLQTHENQRALFYDDLLADKIVMINCMSVRNDDVYPVTHNLAKVQKILGDRVGRDIFMYSLSVDPEHDTPRVLAAFAKKHGVGPGWLFLTGENHIVQTLRGRLFAHAGAHHHLSEVQDCSLGLVRYGNEATGNWGSVPAKANPEWIAERFLWLVPRERPPGPHKRRGPAIGAWMQPSSRIQDDV